MTADASDSEKQTPAAWAVAGEITGIILGLIVSVGIGALVAIFGAAMAGMNADSWGIGLMLPMISGAIGATVGFTLSYGVMRWISRNVGVALVVAMFVQPIIAFGVGYFIWKHQNQG